MQCLSLQSYVYLWFLNMVWRTNCSAGYMQVVHESMELWKANSSNGTVAWTSGNMYLCGRSCRFCAWHKKLKIMKTFLTVLKAPAMNSNFFQWLRCICPAVLHLQDDATAIAASLGRLAKGKDSFRSFQSWIWLEMTYVTWDPRKACDFLETYEKMMNWRY